MIRPLRQEHVVGAQRGALFLRRHVILNKLDRVNHQIAIEAKRLGLTMKGVRALAGRESR